MIKNVKCLSRLETLSAISIERWPHKKWGHISVATIQDEAFMSEHRIAKSKQYGCVDVLELIFLDLDPEGQREVYIFGENRMEDITKDCLTPEQAKQIVEFIDRINEMEDVDLLVNCHAGVSRSGAIGEFAVEYLGLDHKEFLKENARIQPNPWVKKLLKKEAKVWPYDK